MSGSVLITGAQGFVGRYVSKEMLAAGWRRVVGVGRSPLLAEEFTHDVWLGGSNRPAHLTDDLRNAVEDPRYQYRQADVTNPESLARVIAEFAPDVIVHLASTRREESVERLIEGNVQGICAVFDACRASGHAVRRIVLGSSGGVYGDPAELPLSETAACVPADPYAASKLSAEHFGRVLSARAGIELVIGRIFNVVGPGQEERHVCGRLASQVAAVKRDEMPPVVSITNPHATRDYVDVRDVAIALELLARRGQAGEIYNIGTGIETSVREILEHLIQLAGADGRIRVEQREETGAGIARHFASVEKLDRAGRWRRLDLRASLAETLSYYLAGTSGDGELVNRTLTGSRAT